MVRFQTEPIYRFLYHDHTNYVSWCVGYHLLNFHPFNTPYQESNIYPDNDLASSG